MNGKLVEVVVKETRSWNKLIFVDCDDDGNFRQDMVEEAVLNDVVYGWENDMPDDGDTEIDSTVLADIDLETCENLPEFDYHCDSDGELITRQEIVRGDLVDKGLIEFYRSQPAL